MRYPRAMSRWRVLSLLSLLVAADSVAEGRRVLVDEPAQQPAAVAPNLSHTIVLDRCKGGCPITKGSPTSATGLTSSIPQGPGPFTFGEFVNGMGQTGAAADAEWNQILTCVRQVYSPFNVTI